MSDSRPKLRARDYVYGAFLLPWLFMGAFVLFVWGVFTLVPFFSDGGTLAVLNRAPAANVFVGTAQLASKAPALTVPKTGHPAIVVDFRVRQVEVTGSQKHLYYPLFHDRRSAPFLLKTPTNTYRVAPGYVVYTAEGFTEPLGALPEVESQTRVPALPAWALRWHGRPVSARANLDYELSASALVPGTVVTVVARPQTVDGTLTLGPSPSAFTVLVGNATSLNALRHQQRRAAFRWFVGLAIWLSPFVLPHILSRIWPK